MADPARVSHYIRPMTDTAAPPADDRPLTQDGPPVRLYLIDGSGYIFRAFHALPPMTRGDGTPVNAVYGYSSMLMKLLDVTIGIRVKRGDELDGLDVSQHGEQIE